MYTNESYTQDQNDFLNEIYDGANLITEKEINQQWKEYDQHMLATNQWFEVNNTPWNDIQKRLFDLAQRLTSNDHEVYGRAVSASMAG